MKYAGLRFDLVRLLVACVTLVAGHAAFAEDAVAAPVPEPGILALITVGAAVGALVYRNRRK